MLPNVRAMFCLVFSVLVLLVSETTRAEEAVTKKSVVKERATVHMTLTQAALLGLVEGATEYLPVSSTGHLLLAERMMGMGEAAPASARENQHAKEALDAYTICIQAGAILAVVGLYLRRVKEMLMGLLGKDPTGLKMVRHIAVAFLPAAVIGLLLNKLIKAYLFGPWPVVVAWFAGGLAILAVAWWRRVHGEQPKSGAALGDMTWRMALVIGIAQCIAMWPGVSRSLVTIVGGVMVGLSMPAAVEFSFLLGVVTLGAATSYDAVKHGQVMLQTFDILSLIVGLIVALVSAALSVKWMVSYLNRHGLELFGYYRVALALVVATLIVTKVLSG
jgi:undecaprenyl-diphosphatase